MLHLIVKVIGHETEVTKWSQNNHSLYIRCETCTLYTRELQRLILIESLYNIHFPKNYHLQHALIHT